MFHTPIKIRWAHLINLLEVDLNFQVNNALLNFNIEDHLGIKADHNNSFSHHASSILLD